MKFFFSFFLGLFFCFSLGATLLSPEMVHAAGAIPFDARNAGLSETFTSNSQLSGEAPEGVKKVNDTLMAVVHLIRNILGVLAVLWLTYSGLALITAGGDESLISEQKKGVMWSVLGLMLVFLIEPFVLNVLYGGGSEIKPGEAILDIDSSIDRGQAEIEGMVKWIRTIIGGIAVFMIVLSGMKVIFSADDETLGKQKATFLWTGIGMMILLLDEILIDTIYGSPEISSNSIQVTSNPLAAISEATGIIAWILGFVAVIAVLALVYGGFLMIFSAGDEENAATGKKIVLNVILGVIIILTSYTIIATLVM